MIRIGTRVFRPAALPTIAMLALLSLLLWLGFWQLDRAEQKRELLSLFEQGDAYVLDLNEPGSERRAVAYQQVSVRGEYDGARQILVDGMVRERVSGYHVLTPLRLADGRGWLLVNRGWIRPGPTRESLPRVEVDDGTRALRGRLAGFPEPGMRLGPNDTAREGPWPRLMLYPSHSEVEVLLGAPVLERLLLLDEEEPDGYVREWRPATAVPPARHVAYAAQWFAFAGTLVVIYLVLSLKEAERK